MSQLKEFDNTREVKWAFLLWLFATFFLTLIASIICTAWLVRDSIQGGGRLSQTQSSVIISISRFPGHARIAYQNLVALIKSRPEPLLIKTSSIKQTSWVHRFPSKKDNGYLLLSGVSPRAKQSIVQLIRIKDGKNIAEWIPDWESVYSHITDRNTTPSLSPFSARAIHPLLLSNGDIIFNTLDTLVRMSPCDRRPVWVINRIFHHSNEFDSTGKFWTPSIENNGFTNKSWINDRILDNSLTQITVNGTIVESRSFIRILQDNGLIALALGTSGFTFNADPIHINQITPAMSDSKHWKQGDLLISARHLSTIFLYRPSTNKIIWHKTGPWINQHSAVFIDDHRISVFSNNAYTSAPKGEEFLPGYDKNRLFVYDFDTQSETEPFRELLRTYQPQTITEGRARILPDGGLFVEETNNGRMLRFSKNSLLWSYINRYSENRIGMLNWSRYLTKDESEKAISSLASRKCK